MLVFNPKTKLHSLRSSILIFLLTVFFSLTVFGQIQNEDNKQNSSEKVENEKLDKLIDETIKIIDKLNILSTPELFQEGLSKASNALDISRKIKSKASESISLFLIARVFEEKRDWNKAIDYYKQTLDAIEVSKETISDKLILNKIRNAEIITLKNLGRINIEQEFYEDALKWLRQALSLYQENEINVKKGIILRYIGDCERILGRTLQAETAYAKAIEIFDALNSPLDKGIVLNGLGRILRGKDKLGEALQKFLDAEKLLENSPPKSSYLDSRIFNLHAISTAYLNLGDKANADLYINKAKSLQQNILTLENFTLDFFIRGKELVDSKKPKEALQIYQDGLNFISKFDRPDLIYIRSRFLIEIAFIFYSLGNSEEGLKNMLQAIEVVKDLKDKSHMAYVFERVGDDAYNSNGVENAIVFWRRAILSLQKDEEMGVRMKYSEELAQLLNKIAKAQVETGNIKSALVNYRTSLTLQMTLNNKIELVSNLQNLMTGFAKLNKDKLAILFGKLAVKFSQESRLSLKILPVESQKAFLKQNRKTYEQLIELLIQEDRLEEAHQIFNLFKDEEFFDLPNQKNQTEKLISRTKREDVAFIEIQKFESKLKILSDSFDRLNIKLGFRKPTEQEKIELDTIRSSIVEVAGEFDKSLQEIEKGFSSPPDEKDKVGDVPDTSEMLTALLNLNQQPGRKTVAVYTLVGQDNFRALIVSPDLPNKIKAVFYPIKRNELNDKALKLWGLLQSNRYDTTVLSKQIYDVVFAPIEAGLPIDTTLIMWNLDSNLRYFPMAALWDGKQFLAERFSHVVFTRASAERLTKKVSLNWTGTAFGSSKERTVKLPDDKDNIFFKEIRGVTQTLQSIFRKDSKNIGILSGKVEVISDDEFTANAFYEAMKKRRPLVHISSHFYFTSGDDLRSFLVLGKGFLTLNEMKKHTDLFQDVELLMLSACSTAAIKPGANGKEIDGFAELAQRLGADAVMATLWDVSDASTPWLMRGFYETRESKIEEGKTGKTKAEALQKAQLGLLNGTTQIKPLGANLMGSSASNVKIVITPDGKPNGDTRGAEIIYIAAKDAPLYKIDNKKRFAHPFYWSPFVLYGNWK